MYRVKNNKKLLIGLAFAGVLVVLLAFLISTSQIFASQTSDADEPCEPVQLLFSNQNDNKAVNVHNTNNNTMTFYYDSKDHSSEGTVYEVPKSSSGGATIPWWTSGWKVTTVTIDSTFKSFQPDDCKEWFKGFSSLTTINNVSNINTSSATSLSKMFYGCEKLPSLNLSGLSTPMVSDFSEMFRGCKAMSSLNLSNFNTNNASEMSCMFYGCEGLTSLDCSSFRTGNATNMRDMFDSCTNLTTLNVSNFDTHNAYVECMFQNCSKLVSISLPQQFVIARNSISTIWLFDGCSSLASIDCNRFKITGDTYSLTGFFKGCSSLKSLDLSSWDISNVYSFSEMFEDCTSLTSISMPKTLCSTKGAELYRTFLNCTVLKVIDATCFAYFDGTKIDSSLVESFKGCTSLTTIYAPENADWSATWGGTVKPFEGCTSLKGGKGTAYDAGKITTERAVVDGYNGKPGYFTFAGKPTNVKATGAPASINLTWTAGIGCSKYAISTTFDGINFTTHTLDCTQTSYTISGLEDNTTYKCLVQGYVGGKWTGFDSTDLVSATTKTSKPAPTVVKNGDGYSDIKWNAIEGATAYAIAEMENGTYRNYTTEWTGTTYHCDNLANGYEHYILVQAYVNGAWSKFDKSNYCSAFPTGPTKPTATVKSTTDHSITLSWSKVAGSTSYAAAARDNSGNYITKIVDANTTTAEIDGLTDSANYDCLVQCQIYGVWSSFTESDFVHTSTKGNRPVPRQVETGDGYADIAWDAIPSATAYAIATIENGSYKNYSTTCTETSYHCDNLANGYSHYILVQAYVDGKWSPFSKDNYLLVSVDGQTKKPTTSVSGKTDCSISISWNQVPGASEYAAAVRDSNGNYKSVYLSVETGKSHPTTATIDGLCDGAEYKAIVQCKIFGIWSTFSEEEMVATKTTSNRPKPTQTAIGDGYADISWSAISGATAYAIAEMENGSYRNYTTEWTGTTYHCDNLANGYDHYILVQAYVNGKWTNFDKSNYLTVHPTGATKPAPSVASTTSSSVTLKWAKVAGAQQYAAAVRLDDGSYKTVIVDKNTTTATIDGLQPGKTYKCLVQCQIYGVWSSFTESDLIPAITTS